VVSVPLDSIRSTPSLCGALSPQCSLVVVPDVAASLMSVALTTLQMTIMLSVQLVLRLVVQLPTVRVMALHLAWRCPSSRKGVWRWDTFLYLVELLVPFLQMSALGAASTDMLLSLPILLLESSSDSLAS
jgi:hypothetical protein